MSNQKEENVRSEAKAQSIEGIRRVERFYMDVITSNKTESFADYQARVIFKLKEHAYSLRGFMKERAAAQDQNDVGYLMEYSLASCLVTKQRAEEGNLALLYTDWLNMRHFLGSLDGILAAINYKLSQIASKKYVDRDISRRLKVNPASGGVALAQLKRSLYHVLYDLVKLNYLENGNLKMSIVAEDQYENFTLKAQDEDLLYLLPEDKEFDGNFSSTDPKTKEREKLDQEKILRSMARWLSKWQEHDKYFKKRKPKK